MIKLSLAFLNRFSKREKTIFFATAFVTGIMIGDQLIVQPLVKTFDAMGQELEDLNFSIKKSVRLLSQKDGILKQAKEYASYSLQAKSPEEESVALLKYIEDLANEANVNLLYVKPGGEKEEGKAKKYLVNLECESQARDLISFFYRVEDSDQLLKIEKYTIQPTATGSSVLKSGVTISKTVVR